MGRGRRGSAATALLLATFLALTGCSVIGRPPADVPDGMEWDPVQGLITDPLARDAWQVARDTGLPYHEVLERLRAQQRLDEIIGQLVMRYPTFVGVQWTDDGGLIAQFKGAVPADALAALEASGVSVTPVQVRYTTAELEALQDDVLVALVGMGIPADDLVVATDARTQRILVSVRGSVGLAKERIRAALPDHLRPDVSIDVVIGPEFREYAGVRVDHLASGGASAPA